MQYSAARPVWLSRLLTSRQCQAFQTSFRFFIHPSTHPSSEPGLIYVFLLTSKHKMSHWAMDMHFRNKKDVLFISVEVFSLFHFFFWVEIMLHCFPFAVLQEDCWAWMMYSGSLCTSSARGLFLFYFAAMCQWQPGLLRLGSEAVPSGANLLRFNYYQHPNIIFFFFSNFLFLDKIQAFSCYSSQLYRSVKKSSRTCRRFM